MSRYPSHAVENLTISQPLTRSLETLKGPGVQLAGVICMDSAMIPPLVAISAYILMSGQGVVPDHQLWSRCGRAVDQLRPCQGLPIGQAKTGRIGSMAICCLFGMFLTTPPCNCGLAIHGDTKLGGFLSRQKQHEVMAMLLT